MATPVPPIADQAPLLGTARPVNSRRRYLLISGLLLLFATIAIIFGGGSGQTWQNLTAFPGHPLVVLIDPQNTQRVYVGTEQGQVLTSLDGGQTWAPQQRGLPAGAAISALLMTPADAQLFAGTSAGVFVSTDNGQTWTAMSQGLPNDTVDALTIAASNGSTVLLAGTTVHGVYRSTNLGQSWVPVVSGLPTRADIYTLTTAPLGKQIFAGLIGDGIAVSADGGLTWQADSTGIPHGTDVFTLLITPDHQGNPAHYYAGTSVGLFVSADGMNWTAGGTGLGQTRILALISDPLSTQLLYAGTDNGVFESGDSGATWRMVAHGLAGTAHIGALAISRPTQAAVGFNTAINVLYAGSDQLFRFPSTGFAQTVGVFRIGGIVVLFGLLFFLTFRQNTIMRSLLPAREIPGGYQPPSVRRAAQEAARAHIRGGPPPVATIFPAAGGAMEVNTRRGPVSAIFTPVMGTLHAVVMIGEGRQPQDGPMGAFRKLSEDLQEAGVLSLRLAMRDPTNLVNSVADVMGTLDVLERHGIKVAGLVGWGFGAAVAINAALERDLVQGVVAIALPTADTEGIDELSPCALLVLHGAEDIVTPLPAARDRFNAAGEPKELVIFPGDGHALEGHRVEIVEKIVDWYQTTCAGDVPVTRRRAQPAPEQPAPADEGRPS